MEEPDAARRSHQFGGGWTVVKLDALRRYLEAYSQALKYQPFRKLFIDAFAGTGSVDVRINGEQHERDGSAKIALDSQPPFDALYFIEQRARRVNELRTLAEQYPGRVVDVRRGDANTELREICSSVDWNGCRAVLFLDPYGMQVDWPTLEAIAATRAVDVWYLFPINALVRQLARDADAIDEDKRSSIGRLLGTSDWESEFYSLPPTGDLFGAQRRRRDAEWNEVLDYATSRLARIFPEVLAPKVLRLGVDAGPPIFALYFLVSNPDPRARAIATRIATHILKAV